MRLMIRGYPKHNAPFLPPLRVVGVDRRLSVRL